MDSNNKRPREETTYMMETPDGFMVRVPESKAADWQEAQSKPAAPLNKAELQLKGKIMQRLYGGRG